MFVRIQKNEEKKIYSTTFVLCGGDRFYLPTWDEGDREYMRIPQGFVLYYPYNSPFLHGDIQARHMRYDYNFKLGKFDEHGTPREFSYQSKGRDTVNPPNGNGVTPHFINTELNFRFGLDEFVDENYHSHMNLSDERLRVRGEIMSLREEGWTELQWEDDNSEETKPFYFTAYNYHGKILRKMTDVFRVEDGSFPNMGKEYAEKN
tara:strand:+ start:3231 stop:3845 length:615 start_codon:yes stop_codon:yes gene_type:complete